MHNFLLPVESVTVPVPDISFVESPPIDSNLDETIASSSVRDTVGIESNSEESDSMTGPESEIHDIDKVDPDIFHDAGVWNIPLSDPIRIELVSRGPVDLQNKEGPFISVEKHGSRGENRTLSKEWFYRILENGEKVLRSWMLYSPISGCLYCFCCRLFLRSPIDQTQSAFALNGFRMWWKLNPKVNDHEKSREHLLAFVSWKELAMRLDKGQTLDRDQQGRIESQKKRWVNILHRILDAILFLTKQNLALRGHREFLDGEGNPGNFMELIKLISKYDPVLMEHLTRIRMAPNISISFLSPRIQNEFIELLARHVKQQIIENIREAKYYTILFDSTPDISHNDQMTQIIRYVVIKDDTVQILESFIDFIQFKGKTAEEITKVILQKLSEDGLNIEDCRGQGYDNAATMAGIHNGVQQRIRNVNPKAEFVACTNHSLNLAGVHAAEETVNSITFFGTVERVYSFFSSSTHRWDVLQAFAPKRVKRIVQTRWSARNDAVSVLCTISLKC